jgi:membrane fusion protein (multidrug efflux system)
MSKDDTTPSTGSPRKVAILTVAGLAFVALAGWGFTKWRYHETHESTDDAFVGGHMVPVLARVGGTVLDVAVTENQHVERGDLLVSLEPDELSQQLAQAQAELAAAEATAGTEQMPGQAQARVEQARGEAAALKAQLAAAGADATKAHRDLERAETLAGKEIISQQQRDAAQAADEAAAARVRALEEQQTAAQAAIRTARAGLDEARARLAAARSRVEQATLRLSWTRIVAPASGTVSKRSVEPGQLLQPGQPLLTVVADEGVHVTANFKETQLAAIRTGAPVTLEVDAYDGCEAEGTVESIGGATGSQFALIPADNATGNFTKVVQRVPVRIEVTRGCGEDRPLRPGMSVYAHVATK